MIYSESTFRTKRRPTCEVKVGPIGIGAANPIRIQSMTTSDTRDVDATVRQIIRLADSGCEIARVTVQGKKEAEACEKIKQALLKQGYTIPLVADIHFYPPAALLVADFADKVRINPGNFVDRRAIFKTIEYDNASYTRELEKIEEGFSPLVEKCKRLNKAIRIGTNHGSLSDRIMNRFGDSPKGMVESALEFARVCRKLDFHNFLFSMKASNPIVMIQAYRLLVAEMMRLGWDYPLHLGVTEAGHGEDGRIKSAMGIGALLLDGLGDTIRVSLTEDPWQEIDPCKRLRRLSESWQGRGIEPFEEKTRDISDIEQRAVKNPLHPGGSVVLRVSKEEFSSPTFLADLGAKPAERPDALLVDWVPESSLIQNTNIPIFQSSDICILKGGLFPKDAPRPPFILFEPSISPLHETRYLIDDLKQRGLDIPVILGYCYTSSLDDLLLQAGAEIGAALCDRLGEGICLKANLPIALRRSLSFTLLQSARMRMTRTDYISCPGCGRTLFDLQQVAERIRTKTSHLAGVKIAIMGCIVNGPGEMADADFGYVGSKPGKIDLYVGKTCVQKDIEFADADTKLIELIQAHGKWEEPS